MVLAGFVTVSEGLFLLHADTNNDSFKGQLFCTSELAYKNRQFERLQRIRTAIPALAIQWVEAPDVARLLTNDTAKQAM